MLKVWKHFDQEKNKKNKLKIVKIYREKIARKFSENHQELWTSLLCYDMINNACCSLFHDGTWLSVIENPKLQYKNFEAFFTACTQQEYCRIKIPAWCHIPFQHG